MIDLWQTRTGLDNWQLNTQKDLSSFVNPREISYDALRLDNNKIYIRDYDPEVKSFVGDASELTKLE